MKKILFTILFAILIIYSCFFPQITLEASKTGIRIWFQQILPALLPFTILSGVLIKSNFLQSFSKNGSRIAILLTIVCGFVFGFPIGAKLSADFYKNGLLSEKQAILLAVLSNNFSPMYVCGYVLPTLFETSLYYYPTCILIYGIPLILITIIFLSMHIQKQYTLKTNSSCLSKTKLSVSEKPFSKEASAESSFQLDMNIMDAGIITGFESLIRICGYIVLFSIIADIFSRLWNPAPFAWNQILGNLEITNGIYLLSQSKVSENIKYIAAIQLLSFGGLSGTAQTASIFGIKNNNAQTLSVYKYIIGKVILSLLLTLLSIIYII